MKSLKIGPVRIKAGFSNVNTGEERSAQVAVVGKHRDQRALGFRCGWGYDEDLPLRPWPSYALTTSRTSRDLCVGGFGFYVGLSRELPEHAANPGGTP